MSMSIKVRDGQTKMEKYRFFEAYKHSTCLIAVVSWRARLAYIIMYLFCPPSSIRIHSVDFYIPREANLNLSLVTRNTRGSKFYLMATILYFLKAMHLNHILKVRFSGPGVEPA